jgi:hypothetical protein
MWISLQLSFGVATENWLWYKPKLTTFIGNWFPWVSDITENLVLVCKVAPKPRSIYWNRSQGRTFVQTHVQTRVWIWIRMSILLHFQIQIQIQNGRRRHPPTGGTRGDRFPKKKNFHLLLFWSNECFLSVPNYMDCTTMSDTQRVLKYGHTLIATIYLQKWYSFAQKIVDFRVYYKPKN